MNYGWAGTILHVDLTKEKIIKEPSTKYTKLFVGQRGVNVKLFYDHSQPGQSCFDPETPIIIGTGVLAGTGAIGAAKLEITTRSPEQEEEGYANTAFGSYFASELKWAGYDNIVIKGKASTPKYITIIDGQKQINDASDLWGLDCVQTEDILKERQGPYWVETRLGMKTPMFDKAIYRTREFLHNLGVRIGTYLLRLDKKLGG